MESMKRFLLLSWAALLGMGSSLANPTPAQCEVHFHDGNAAYEAGDFEGAVAAYEAGLLACDNFETEFNLGNAYFKLGQLGLSILHFERALQLNPSDDDARNNLKLAGTKVIDRIEPLPTQGLRDVWERVVAKGRLNFWRNMLLILWLSGFAGLSWRALSKEESMKRIAGTVAAALLVLSIAVGFLYSATSHRDDISHKAIVLAPTTEVRNAPQLTSSLVLFVLHEGTKGRILSRSEEWIELELANGSVGWVHTTEVEEI
jgi:tetratricopeptide (TPR) repeat protein